MKPEDFVRQEIDKVQQINTRSESQKLQKFLEENDRAWSLINRKISETLRVLEDAKWPTGEYGERESTTQTYSTKVIEYIQWSKMQAYFARIDQEEYLVYNLGLSVDDYSNPDSSSPKYVGWFYLTSTGNIVYITVEHPRQTKTLRYGDIISSTGVFDKSEFLAKSLAFQGIVVDDSLIVNPTLKPKYPLARRLDMLQDKAKLWCTHGRRLEDIEHL